MRKLFIIKMKKLKDGKVSGKEEINKVRISDLYDIKNTPRAPIEILYK